MRPVLSLSLLPCLLLAAGVAHAAAASFTAGKGQLLCGASGELQATWSGACKDGLADGAGVATWTDGAKPSKLVGTLVRGEAGDGATLVHGETTYIGNFLHFAPHGQGFFKYPNGSMYEGGIDHGKYSGPGIFQAVDKSRYEGMWVDGRREGQGQATFTIGGSYDGHWHHDKFDGAGTIVYVGGRSYTGQFKDGRVAGLPPLGPVEEHTFRITNTENHVRSLIPAETAISSVSGNKWADLTESERRIIMADYPAMEDGDEPPYPVNGTRPLMAAMVKVGYVDFSFEGDMHMNVLVSAEGRPISATTVGQLPPEVAQYLGGILMITAFKPAVCHGKPCQMLLPVKSHFIHKL